MTSASFALGLAVAVVSFSGVTGAAEPKKERPVLGRTALGLSIHLIEDSELSAQRRRPSRTSDVGRRFSGRASYYWQGKRVASGGRFNPRGFTCAHRSLPFGTRVRVTDPKSKRSVVVTVNDRGPFTGGRVLDLSLAAAQALGMTSRGVIQVMAEVL
jgi:rare lipoprotein A